VFWVISVHFNIRNTFPKSGTFLLGHPVYALLMFGNCLKMIKIDENMELLQIVCKNIILTLMHLLVLLCELSVYLVP